MVRSTRFFAISLLLLLVVSGSVAATTFGYSDVYWLNEKTGNWVKDDGTGASLEKKGSGESTFGNSGGSALITGSTIIAFGDDSLNTLSSFGSLSTLALGNSYTWVNDPSNEIFSITAEALPFDDINLVNMVWDEDADEFFLPHKNTVATWRFTYKVTNNSDVTMEKVEVSDNFNGELVIVESSAVVSGVTDSVVFINKKGGNGGSYELTWSKFSIPPGGSAELTLLVVTGMNPGGHQQYNECGTHFLHSGGVLKYKPDGKGQKSIGGGDEWRFKVRVCDDPPSPPEDHPTVCFEVSASSVNWFIRKPGDFYAKVLDARVRVSGGGNTDVIVAVTFSDFDNLISDSGQVIPVRYSFADEPDLDGWMTPADLNGIVGMELTASAENDASFSMWQRIVLDTQSPGTYQNVGVITFTLVNSQPYFE